MGNQYFFSLLLKEIASAAHEVGAKVMYDGAHVLGLIAGGQFQDPLREGADVMTGLHTRLFQAPRWFSTLSSQMRKCKSG